MSIPPQWVDGEDLFLNSWHFYQTDYKKLITYGATLHLRTASIKSVRKKHENGCTRGVDVVLILSQESRLMPGTIET